MTRCVPAVVLGLAVALAPLSSAYAQAKPSPKPSASRYLPKYNAAGELLLPENFHEWIYVNATLLVSDDYVDLTASTGIDIAIRAGETPDARLTARRLGSLRRVTFASREYLAEHGRPQHPDDLRRHACVIRKGVAGAANWRYRSADGAEESIPVTGRLEADSIMAVNAAVIAGAGVGRALYWQIEDLVRSGQLELLLVGFEPEPVPLRALWVPNRHMPARTRLFIDALAQALGNRSL